MDIAQREPAGGEIRGTVERLDQEIGGGRKIAAPGEIHGMAIAAVGGLGASGAIVAALLHNASTLIVMANAGRLLKFQEVHA